MEQDILLKEMDKAITNQDVNKIKEIINQGFNINKYIKIPGTYGDPYLPLFMAAEYGFIESMKTLIECGADVKLKDKDGKTVLDYLLWDINEGDENLKLVKMLFAKGYKLGNLQKHTIAELMDEKNKKVYELLVQNGFKISNDNLDSALWSAAEFGNFDIIPSLIEQGADVNAKQKNDERSVLMNACMSGNEKLVRFLVEKGARINYKSEEGETALHYIRAHGSDVEKNNKTFEILKLLIEKGADINAATNYGDTILNHAVRDNEIEIINYLIKKGAKINNMTLIEAASRGNFEIVKMAIKLGADVNSKEAGYGGFTALFRAVHSNNIDIVKYLIENGADVNAQLDNGNILEEAEGKGYDDIVDYLIKHGATRKPSVFEQLGDLLCNKSNHASLRDMLLDLGSDYDDGSDDEEENENISMLDFYEEQIEKMISIYGDCKQGDVNSIISAINDDDEMAYVGNFLLHEYSFSDISDYHEYYENIEWEEIDTEMEIDFESNSTEVVKLMAICFTLGKMKDKRACSFLHNCVKNFQFYIRWIAAWALGEIGNKESLGVLQSIENDKYEMEWTAGLSAYEAVDSYDPLARQFYEYIHNIYSYSGVSILNRAEEKIRKS